MANQASINPSDGHRVMRNIGRVKTLKDAIAKHQERGNTDKAAALQEELDRRMAELNEVKAALEDL